MLNIVIIIPSYNSGGTIVETIQSILTQNSLDKVKAVYLADDCSTDDSVALAASNWKSPIDFHVIKGAQNLGERGNVNNCLRRLNGSADWILILHSDDIAKPNWLESIISRMELCAGNVGSICSSWDNLLPDGSVLTGEDNPQRAIEVINGGRNEVIGTLKKGCWWHLSGCAIRMEAFVDVGDFNLGMPQVGDWEWLLRCLNKGWGVEYIPRTLITYRQHSASVSSRSFALDRDVLEGLVITQQYVELLSKKDLLTLHSVFFIRLLRRFVRAFIEFRPKRCVNVAGNLFKVVTSFFRNCKRAGHSSGLSPVIS